MLTEFQIGHYTDTRAITGCTVVLAPPEGAVGGVDVRGPAPGTRETELLRTGHLVERAHAVLLSGGSAFGLDCAAGVMRFLAEQHVGFDAGITRVPIVPAAVLFDLGIGELHKPLNADSGYVACVNATNADPQEGSVGAGTGASVGKVLGPKFTTKSGVGYAESEIGASEMRIKVAAFVVVNAFGDVIEPESGKILAGVRHPDANAARWFDTSQALRGDPIEPPTRFTNTTLGVILTDAVLNTEQSNIIAMMAQDGIARAVRPAHSMYDGDTLFVLASGKGHRGNLTAIGDAAAECVARAIVRGVKSAVTLGGVPAWNE